MIYKHLFLLMLTVISLNMKSQQYIYKYQVGSFALYLLSENQGEGNKDILINATKEMLEKFVPDGKFPNAMNCFFLETEKETYLFDTGMGIKLFDNLKSLRRTPEEINGIFITHMHGDHFGGLVKDGKKCFPNVKLYISKAEYEYWMSEVAKNADNARKVLKMYDENIVLFEPGTFEKPYEPVKGIKSISIYGHTPGHTGYMIESEGNKIFIWGDLTHAMAIQMPYPQVAVTYDVFSRMAVATRKWILKYVRDNKIPVAGMHISFPGMGYVTENNEQEYVFVPINQ